MTGDPALVPGELRGYRRFRLAADGLHPTVQRTGAWAALEQATCVRHRAHTPPVAGCGCGLYGWYHPADADVSGFGDVTAVIAARGRVVLGEHGFRATAARVEAVALPWTASTPARRRMLAERYPDAVVYGSVRRMLRAHPPQSVVELGVGGGPSRAARDRRAALGAWLLGVAVLYGLVLLPWTAAGPGGIAAGILGFLAWQALLVRLFLGSTAGSGPGASTATSPDPQPSAA
jgi:hypothetical protein